MLNDPANVDTNAPIVTSVSTDRQEYALGESMQLTLTVLDKSPLCTSDLHQRKECEYVGHIAMVERSSGREVDVYPETTLGQNGTYQIDFELSGDNGFTSGEYKIIGINVYDIWGNSMHPLRPSIQAGFRVVE